MRLLDAVDADLFPTAEDITEQGTPRPLLDALVVALVPRTVGEVEPARALAEDTLQRCRRVLGPDSPLTLGAAAALAQVLVRLGEVSRARALGQDTLQRSRRVFSPSNPIALYLTQTGSIG